MLKDVLTGLHSKAQVAGLPSTEWPVKLSTGLISPGLWMFLHRFVLQQEILLGNMIREKG